MIQPKLQLQQVLSKQIYNVLQGDMVEKLLRESKISNADNYWRSIMEGHSFKVEEKLLKHLFSVFQGVKDTLGVNEPVDFYITGDATVNAFSVAAEQKGEPHIVNINSGLIQLMTEDELRFVIGHELGHIINQDTRLRRLINLVYAPDEGMPIGLFHRVRLNEQLAELVADRYGFLAVGHLGPCVSAFFKMASGLDISKIDVKLEALIEENLRHLDYFLNDKGLSRETHPVNPIRIQSLYLYSKAESKKELDEQMQPLIDILLRLGNSPVDYHISRFVATAGLIVASADGDIKQEEVDTIIANLSQTQMFPRHFLEDVSKSDVNKIFIDSIQHILREEPQMRDDLLLYLIEIVLSDREISKAEVNLVYDLGKNIFGYQKRDVARMMVAMVQSKFVPNLRNLSN